MDENIEEKKPWSRRAKLITMIVAGAVLLITLAVTVGAWVYYESKLDKINFVEPPTLDGFAVEPTDTDPGHFNLLLMGTDERSQEFSVDARSDATMILSLDLEKHTARLVSLERGIGVPIDGMPDDWLTHVFRYGGADMMMKTVREQFEISLDGYVRVNFYAFEQIINAIGGVDITLTEVEAAALNGEIHTNATTKHRVEVGLNHLDGFDALQYARERFIDDDWHRIARQRAVMQAAIDQTKNLKLSQLNALLDETLPLVQTNLTKKQITGLLPYAPSFLGVRLDQMSLPLPGTFGSYNSEDGRSLMLLDFTENARVLHKFLYASFDPTIYKASKTITDAIYAEQAKRATAWAIAHPEPISSEVSEEEVLPEDTENPTVSGFDPNDPNDDKASRPTKRKTDTESAREAARAASSGKDTSSVRDASSAKDASSVRDASSGKDASSAKDASSTRSVRADSSAEE